MEKNYKIAFIGYDPNNKINKTHSARPYFRKDTLSFESQSEMMEFFDNLEKIVAHLRNTEIVKMLVDHGAKGLKVAPKIEMVPYIQGEGSSNRIYLDDRREIDMAVQVKDASKNIFHGEITNASHKLIYVDGEKYGEEG